MFALRSDLAGTRDRIRSFLDGDDDVDWYVDEGNRIVAYVPKLGPNPLYFVVELASLDDERTLGAARYHPDNGLTSGHNLHTHKHAYAMVDRLLTALEDQRDDVVRLHEHGAIDPDALAPPAAQPTDSVSEGVADFDSSSGQPAEGSPDLRDESSETKAIDPGAAARKRTWYRVRRGLYLLGVIVLIALLLGGLSLALS